MNPLRVAMIGCGENAAKTILPCADNTGAVQFVAMMDLKLDLAQELAEQTGAAMATTSYDEVLNNPDVEAVFISTPHALHVPQGVQAAAHGKHVLMDKPLATHVADAEKLIAACKDAGVLLSVMFGKRFSTSYDIGADLFDKGAIGKVTGLNVTSYWTKPESYWTGGYTNRVKTDWRTNKAMSGGGMLMINYSHNLDGLHNRFHLVPKTVYAQVDNFGTPVEVEDAFSVVVRYENGAIGTFCGSSATPGGTRDIPDMIFGTEGTLMLGNPVRVFTVNEIEGLTRNDWTEIPWQGSGWEGPGSYQVIIENFAKAVRGEEPLLVTGENAISSLKVIEGAYRSQESGTVILL